MGDADRDADRPRLRDERPEDAEPDRALREPCGDGVRRRLLDDLPEEAEPERPESVRRRRRVGVRGGVLILVDSAPFSAREAGRASWLPSLMSCTRTGGPSLRGLPSGLRRCAGSGFAGVVPADWALDAPGAAAGLRISIKEAPTRRLGAARVDRVPLTRCWGLPTRLAGTGS